MRRVSSLLLVLACTTAYADDAREAKTRARLSDQLAAETAVIETTRTTVDEKVSAADAVRLARVKAAYRLLRAPLRANATASDRLAAARRRAAAHHLLARDRSERTLLADESKQLSAAHERTIVASHRLPEITLPETLAWPAKGQVARTFGTIAHEKSKTTLARRGIDLEVEQKAITGAPAAGVVRFAGPIRGLDNGVIIDHGDYYTVVGKLGELTVAVGTNVAMNDRIGRAARHRIYLELRVKIGPGGIPIDPEPLLGQTASQSR